MTFLFAVILIIVQESFDFTDLVDRFAPGCTIDQEIELPDHLIDLFQVWQINPGMVERILPFDDDILLQAELFQFLSRQFLVIPGHSQEAIY